MYEHIMRKSFDLSYLAVSIIEEKHLGINPIYY